MNADKNRKIGESKTKKVNELIFSIKENVITDYKNGNVKMRELAIKYNTNYAVIQKIISSYDKSFPKGRFKRHDFVKNNPKISDTFLLQQLIDEKYTCKEIASKIGVSPNSVAVFLREYNIKTLHGGPSSIERICRSFIPENIQCDFNSRILDGLEIDIFLPKFSFGIETNGNYFHSSKFRDKRFHLNKTNIAENKGLKLFHFFEDEILGKPNIVRSMILSAIGQTENRIFARKCKIKHVEKTEKTDFLNTNHLKGDCLSSVNIGLYFEDKLVSLMTFGKSRFSKKYTWELLRFCSLLNHSVVGGATKLLKYFRSIYDEDIITYADRRYSRGLVYEKMGFEFVKNTPPNYFYIKGNCLDRMSRLLFQKHKLRDFHNYSDNKTEEEIMKESGYYKIYDCGTSVFKIP
jgi:hypothetical protein